MECKNCELRQRQYYCANCLRNHLRDFRSKTHHFSSGRNEHVARASRTFKFIEPGRLLRAEIARVDINLDQLADGLAKSEKRLREQARPPPYPPRDPCSAQTHTQRCTPPSTPITNAYQGISGARCAESNYFCTRSGLVQELVEVFHVVEVGGRPTVGGRPGARGEWTVGGLVLPVPGDVRRWGMHHSLTLKAKTKRTDSSLMNENRQNQLVDTVALDDGCIAHPQARRCESSSAEYTSTPPVLETMRF
ncbi:hypothetical protein EDD22DRAFT_296738 [Suillus occidentalis]|nr:hypothetical protein EDD22DRAFT_296738 [Suillus occidentalis]